MSQFNDIEAAWYDSASAAIVAHAASQPSERFYAGSFWLLCVDYAMFGLPCFALSTESHIVEHGQDLRWSPADWPFSCIETAIQDMQPHYSALSERLSGRSDADWERAIEAHHACLARVCRRLTHDARSHSRAFSGVCLPGDFVVGIFEFREAEPLFSQLVRASISPEILASLPHPVWEPK